LTGKDRKNGTKSGEKPRTKVDRSAETNGNGAFEAKLWAAADALRNNMDAAEYKHVVLGLIFLKYISDAFEAKHGELDEQRAQGADPKIPTSIVRKISSGCHRKRAGAISNRWRRNRPSASSSTTP